MKALELADYCESLAREIDHSHLTHDLIAAAAELRRLAAVEAELERIKALKPVDFFRWICIGGFTEPLYIPGSKT